MTAMSGRPRATRRSSKASDSCSPCLDPRKQAEPEADQHQADQTACELCVVGSGYRADGQDGHGQEKRSVNAAELEGQPYGGESEAGHEPTEDRPPSEQEIDGRTQDVPRGDGLSQEGTEVQYVGKRSGGSRDKDAGPEQRADHGKVHEDGVADAPDGHARRDPQRARDAGPEARHEHAPEHSPDHDSGGKSGEPHDRGYPRRREARLAFRFLAQGAHTILGDRGQIAGWPLASGLGPRYGRGYRVRRCDGQSDPF